LVADRYIYNQSKDDKTRKRELVRQVAGMDEPMEYAPFFSRWKEALESLPGAECHEAEVLGRTAVGLGEESVLETSIALHHTYGLPYIPGSALKGLAASFARQRLEASAWNIDGPSYKLLFGTTADAGWVTFFDALYVPGSGALDVNGIARPLFADVMTVHHPDYYQGHKAPADWDDPEPHPFLSATGRYLIALAGPPQWVRAAFDILGPALAEYGIGAKTSSGYGRMRLEMPVSPTARLLTEVAATPRRGWLPYLRDLAAEHWSSMADTEDKRQVAQAIVGRVRELGKETLAAGNEWYQQVLSYLHH